MTAPHDQSVRDALLAEIIEQFLDERRQGLAPLASELLKRYPELADELESCLASLDYLEVSASRSSQRRVAPPAPPAPPASAAASAVHSAATESVDEVDCQWPALSDFHIQREIGRGGMGIVYEAHQCSLDRPVALKVLPWATLLDAKDRERFRNEAQAAARLHHTNIVPVFTVGSQRGVDYYAMQYIEGQSLAAVIRGLAENKRPNGKSSGRRAAGIPDRDLANQTAYFRRVARWGVQAAEALHYAHAHGIVHRDVKPSNLLVDVRDNLWMTDFGVARLRPDSSLTGAGDLLGTLRYMSPEQAAGEVVDPRADVYSLGLTLCEALTLEPVFQGDHYHELARQMAAETTPRPRDKNPAIPRDLETILRKATARQRQDRYASAQRMADDLRRFLDDQPILARGPSLVQTVSKWSWRHRSLLAAALLLSVVAVAGLAVSTMLIEGQRAEAIRQRDVAQSEREKADSSTRLAEAAAGREHLAALEATRQRGAARELLARSQADHATRLMEEGDARGLAELVAAHATADESPQLARSIADLWARWHGVLSGRLAQVVGHDAPVATLAFSPAGNLLATAADDGTARLWDAETGLPLSAPLSHSSAVVAIAFDSTGTLLAVGTRDGTVQLWDVPTAMPRQSAWSHGPGAITSLAFSPDGSRLAFTSEGSNEVRIVSPAGSELPIPRLVYTGPVTCCQFSPDGKQLLTAVRNTLHVWDVETGEPTVTGIRDPNTITRFAVSPDGKLVATITPGAVAQCWRLATGSVAAPPLAQSKTIDHAAFSPDGSRLVMAIKDGTVQAWDTATWQLVDPLLERTSRVRSMDFSSDGRLLVVSSVDGSTRLIDPRNATPLGPPVWQQGPVNCVRFRPGSHMFATASQDGTARVWREDWPAGAVRWTHSSAVYSLAFDPCGALLAVGGEAGDVAIWDVGRRQLQRAFAAHGQRVTAVSFSPDGKLLATSSEDCSARFWSVETGDAVGDPLRHAEGVKALAFSPDGKLLATAGNEGSLKLWPVGPSPAPIELFGGGRGKGVKAVAFSPDGRSLAFTTNQRRTEILDVAARRSSGPAIEHVERIRSLAFSLDGQWLLTCSEDGTAQPWTVATRAPVDRLMRHTGAIRGAALAPDGNWFITAAEDKSVRVWDLRSSLACDGVPLLGGETAAAVAVSHDQQWLAIGWTDKSVWLWPLPHRPRDRIDMEEKTRVTLGARTGSDGRLLALDWQAWRESRDGVDVSKQGQSNP